jgi:hypothetical protein
MSIKDSFLEVAIVKLVINEINGVEGFIIRLKYHGSHFLIVKSTIIEEVRKIVTNVTKLRISMLALNLMHLTHMIVI